MRKKTREYNDEIARTRKELQKTREEQNKVRKAFEDLGDSIVGMSARINDVQSFARELERTGAASKEVSRMAIQIGDSLRISGVDYQEATAATKSLVANVTDFTMVSKEMQKSLITDASLFAEAGVSNEQYSKSLQIGIKAMGMSADESAENMRRMRRDALALGVPVTQMTDDFIAAEEKIAQLGATGVKSFRELARVQKITGLEMGKLIQMTDKFDTFEGAAQAAGSLNAALGGNFVDSMSLMMETDPAERFKILRDAIEASGKSLDDMGYYQKKFMAGQLDLSVADFEKMMSGNLDAMEDAADKAASSDAIPTLEAAATNIRSQTELTLNAAKAIEPAYGALAAKAMVITDKVAPSLMEAAKKINQINIKLTETLPDQAAFLAGGIEGLAEGKSILGNIMDLIQSVGIAVMAFPEKMRKVIPAVTKYLSGLGKAISGSLTGLPKSLGAIFTKVDDFFDVLGYVSPKLGGLIKRIPLIGGVISGVMASIEGFAEAFASFTSGDIAEGIAYTGKAIFDFADGFLSAIPGLFVMIGQYFGILEEDLDPNKLISTLLDPLFDGLMESYLTMLDNFEGFTDDFLNMVKEIPSFIGAMVVDIIGIIPTLIDGVIEAFGFDGFAVKLYDGLVDAVSIAFNAMIDAGKIILGIASPSKVFTEMGGNIITSLVDTIKSGVSVLADAAMVLIDGFIAPWKTLGGILMEVISPALDMVPDGIKNLFMGDTAATAGNLQSAAAPATAAAGGAVGATASGQAQVINISLTLDGKEIDKKVINLLGGVAKEAVL